MHNCLYTQARWLHDSEWVPSAGIPSFPQTSPATRISPRSPDIGPSHQSNCGNYSNGEIYITTIAGVVRCFFIYVYVCLYVCMKDLCNMDSIVFALKLFTVLRVTVPCHNLVDGYQHSCTTYCLLSWQKIKAACSSEMFVHTHQITSTCVSPDNHSTCIRTGLWNLAFIILTFSKMCVH